MAKHAEIRGLMIETSAMKELKKTVSLNNNLIGVIVKLILDTFQKFYDDDHDELFLCGMVDRRNAFSLISIRDHCQILTIANLRHAVSRT